MTRGSPSARAKGLPLRGILWAAALGLLLASTALGASAAPIAAPSATPSVGSVDVTFPSAYPNVELSEAGNQSAASALSVDQILEATPSATSPQVDAVALPSHLVVTNGSTPGSPPSTLQQLTADLTVYPSDAALWQGPGDLVQADGAPLGTAHLWINYSSLPASGPAAGVATHWSVSGWPWVASSDLLGVQLSLSSALTHSVVACTGAANSVDSVGCPGTALSSAASLWSTGIVGVQGTIPQGPTASVGWGATFQTTSGATSPVSVGVLAPSPSLGHLILSAPGRGASQLGGNLSFSLLPFTAPISAPAVLHANGGGYLAGLGISIAAGLVGVLAYRGRQRRVEREL